MNDTNVIAEMYGLVLKRFGDTPATRRAWNAAYIAADKEGLTPESLEKYIIVEFAGWIGKQPDGDPSQQLGQAAASVVPPAEPPQLPSEPPAPLQVTPPPFPQTSAALASALGAFSFSSNAGNQGNSISWGAGLPHLQPTWPGQLGPTATPGTQPSDPAPGPGLSSQPQAQADWRIVGQIIAEEIRKSLEKVFEKQIQKATAGQAPLPGVGGANSPRGGVTLPKIIDQMTGRLPPRLREAGRKLGRAFAKSGVGRLARRGVVALGRTKTGRGITQAIGARLSKVGGAGKAASVGGFGGLGRLAGGATGVGMAVGMAISAADKALDKGLQAIKPTGNPSTGYAYQATQQVPFLGPVVKFAEAVDQATDRLAAWNQQVGMFSGTMNRVMAGREMAEVFRSRELGERLSPSAANLVGAEQRRKDAELEYKVVAAEIENAVTGLINNALTEVFDFFRPALETLEDMLGIQKDKSNKDSESMEAAMDRAVEWDKQMHEAGLRRLEKQRQLNK